MPNYSVVTTKDGSRGFIGAKLLIIGAGAQTRTADLLITNQLLYQLSYTGAQPENKEFSG